MAEFFDNNLILDKGETLEFPLDEQSTLIECQRMRPIRSLSDVRDFAFVRDWIMGFDFPESSVAGRDDDDERIRLEASGEPNGRYQYTGSRFTGNELLRLILERWGGRMMELTFADFVVPVGSTVLITAPLAEINANTVVVAGQLKFTDDIVIRCREIRGN